MPAAGSGRKPTLSEEDFRLLVAWLVGTLNPDGPFPVLVLQGEQGSAKSTTVRALRSVVDPAVEPLRAPPRDERDLAIAASGSWVPALDNLSGVRPWLSDALCRLATGGDFATRELYSDDREVIFSQKRPVILNGIDSLAVAGDLRDRSLVIELPPIPPGRKRTEREFYHKLEAARPRVLGAPLDAVSAALRNLERVELEELPRMADFAVWVAASEEALPWEPGAFLRAYAGNRAEAEELALEVIELSWALRNDEYEEVEEWITERELRRDRMIARREEHTGRMRPGGPLGRTPDGLMILSEGSEVAVELSPKRKASYRRIFEYYERQFEKREVDGVRFYFASERAMERVQTIAGHHHLRGRVEFYHYEPVFEPRR